MAGIATSSLMTFRKSNPTVRHPRLRSRLLCCSAALLLGLFGFHAEVDAGPVSTSDAAAGVESNATPCFSVSAYVVNGNALLSTNVLVPMLSRHTGTNVSLTEIVKAASDVQAAYRKLGYLRMSVAIAREQITNGIVTMNLFQTAVPQVVVSGVLCFTPTNVVAAGANAPAVETAPKPLTAKVATNAAPSAAQRPVKPATPEELAEARVQVLQTITDLKAREADKRIHVVSTNAGPRFEVEQYRVTGNSVLTPASVGAVVTNIDGAFGTNVSFEGVETVRKQLQQAYLDRGYVTVAVGVPAQKLTNATVRVEVVEGRLAAINIAGNRYFSSNNVMRALPSLHTNILLNGPILQAELNRANANQDRQIYTVIGPGPVPGTSELTLNVKDRLPLHGKIELNNQNSPGTPELRVNASALEDNLWQWNHSLGVQYGFSPESYKLGNQWDLYDEPLVANYSTFYRLPLGSPEPIENTVANNPGSFGYNEATRQFRLPPPSGQTELNLYASRATIDTGVETLSSETLFDIPFVRQVDHVAVQQGITINDTIGFQLNKPLPEMKNIRSALSAGLDYKVYSQANYQTNSFIFTEYTKNPAGQLVKRVSYDNIPTPATDEEMDYLPLGLNYNASLNNFLGPATLGLGLSANLWYSSSTRYSSASANPPPNLHDSKSLQGITGSSQSSGHWMVFRPSYSQQIIIGKNWITTLRADGQWASEPLISNEQFGIGGVNSVRGYHEGEIFGDTGWHVSLEQQTPQHVVGMVHGDEPLSLRGSVYMDWATAYLLDPQGRAGAIELWGTGFGVAASVGSHWQGQFLFSLPLIGTALTPSGQPHFNFSLTAQF